MERDTLFGTARGDNGFDNPFQTGTASSEPAMTYSRVHPDELNFHDSAYDMRNVQGTIDTVDLGRDVEDNAPLVGGAPPAPKTAPSFWHITYYRPWFDVDSSDVGRRMLNSLNPRHSPETSDGQPDMYGPFWIATSLVFFMAVTGNFSSWISFSPTEHKPQWVYDFTKVTLGATMIYGYVFVLPFLLWALLKWYDTSVPLVLLWCKYGYALTSFLPASVLCAVPSEVFRWIVLVGSTVLSGLCLYLFLHGTLEGSMPPSHKAAKMTTILMGLGAAHVGLALGLKLYFFEYAR